MKKNRIAHTKASPPLHWSLFYAVEIIEHFFISKTSDWHCKMGARVKTSAFT
jgi:hypothetical protein